MKKLFLTVYAFTIALTGYTSTDAVAKDPSNVTISGRQKMTKRGGSTKGGAEFQRLTPPQKSAAYAIPKQSAKKGLGLEISGETSTNLYIFEGRQREPNNGKGRGTHLAVDDSRINFEVFGKAIECCGGLEYSFLIGISGDAHEGENPIQENRLKLKGEWGTFLAGDTRGVSDFMSVGTFYFLGATGGIFGNYKEVINETTGSVIRDDLLNRFTPKDQTKVIYVTPRVCDIQAGYSFTPDGSHKGEQHIHSHTPVSSGPRSVVSPARFAGVNFHEFAINYKGMKVFNCVDIFLSATAIVGKMRDLRRSLSSAAGIAAGVNQANYPFPRRHLNAYALGAVVEYAGFSIGGEFLDNLKSGQLTALKGANLGKVYTIGVGYKKDCNAFSLAYLHSKRNLGILTTPTEVINFGSIKVDNVSLTADHEIAPGLVAYAEAVGFRMKASQPGNLDNWNKIQNGFSDATILSNRGRVFITGARIKF